MTQVTFPVFPSHLLHLSSSSSSLQLSSQEKEEDASLISHKRVHRQSVSSPVTKRYIMHFHTNRSFTNALFTAFILQCMNVSPLFPSLLFSFYCQSNLSQEPHLEVFDYQSRERSRIEMRWVVDVCFCCWHFISSLFGYNSFSCIYLSSQALLLIQGSPSYKWMHRWKRRKWGFEEIAHSSSFPFKKNIHQIQEAIHSFHFSCLFPLDFSASSCHVFSWRTTRRRRRSEFPDSYSTFWFCCCLFLFPWFFLLPLLLLSSSSPSKNDYFPTIDVYCILLFTRTTSSGWFHWFIPCLCLSSFLICLQLCLVICTFHVDSWCLYGYCLYSLCFGISFPLFLWSQQ